MKKKVNIDIKVQIYRVSISKVHPSQISPCSSVLLIVVLSILLSSLKYIYVKGVLLTRIKLSRQYVRGHTLASSIQPRLDTYHRTSVHPGNSLHALFTYTTTNRTYVTSNQPSALSNQQGNDRPLDSLQVPSNQLHY